MRGSLPSILVPRLRLPALAAAALLVAAPAAAGGVAWTVAGTGQTLCYGNDLAPASCPAPGQPFFGQDAQQDRPAPSYRDDGDGTTTDLVTGLTWVKARGTKVTWAAAVAGASTCRVGGHSDWRMPTIRELYSLILFTGVQGQGFTSAEGWVPFLDTRAFDFAYGTNDLVDTGDGAVLDRAKGLAWSRADGGVGMTLQEALAFVQARNAVGYLGHSDWRLPTVKELQSIVDDRRSPDTTGSRAIAVVVPRRAPAEGNASAGAATGGVAAGVRRKVEPKPRLELGTY